MVAFALSPPDPDSTVQQFRDSMPPSYRRAHGAPAVREHAAIVAGRGDARVHLDLWRVRRGTVVVIVTDDRAGGLAMMSAAIAASGFDILVAEAYQRAVQGRPVEAVAFFELRRERDDSKPIEREDLVPIARALESLIEGQTRADGLLRRNARTVPPGPQASPEVSFADDPHASILLVEARDRPGLLATVTSVLTEGSVRIVDCEIVTVGGRVRDRFELVERDGGALSEDRKQEIASKVLGAIERRGDA
jgi:UTP:GlnB (protein PII) uridylyltransferase